MSKLIESR